MSESKIGLKLYFDSEEQYRALHIALVTRGHMRKLEQGAFLFASPNGDGELEVVDIALLKMNQFAAQSARYLQLHHETLQEMIVRAHMSNTALVEAHSHPCTRGPRVSFSPFDLEGLAETGPHVAWRLPGRPYVALVFGRDAFDSLYWEGRDQRPKGCVDLVLAGRLLRASRESEPAWRSDDGQV